MPTKVQATSRIRPVRAIAAAAPIATHKAGDILRNAFETIESRGRERDNAGGDQPAERSMATIVKAFNLIEGTDLDERQGWAFMQVLKQVRAAAAARNGRPDLDDFLDGAAYAALAGESMVFPVEAQQ